ncbi:hypothetical protein [Amycolatopsis tolypomycina]|uniref:hypothetical protein n=1 Tax=Amycolatopsis tolypomycina TaxID=208445 RepID=UPI0033A54ED4
MEADRGDRHVTIGVLADPGVPTALADHLADALPRRLENTIAGHLSWSAERRRDPSEAMFPDSGRLMANAVHQLRDTHWELAVCLTDLPLFAGDGVAAVQVSRSDRVILVSLPALDGFALRRRLLRLLVPVVGTFFPAHRAVGADRMSRSPAETADLRRIGAGSDGVLSFSAPYPATARLLAGLVRANRPWRLVMGLSRARASAVAGSAFGILYPGTWLLATALGPWRMAGAVVAATAALAAWLVLAHGLWERPPGDSAGREREQRLRNTGTVLIVLAGAIVFFLALCVVTGMAVSVVSVVLPPDYPASVLGHPAGVLDYVRIALMASVLGTVAAAIGSGLEDDAKVRRRATYSYRAHERRRSVGHRPE